MNMRTYIPYHTYHSLAKGVHGWLRARTKVGQTGGIIVLGVCT